MLFRMNSIPICQLEFPKWNQHANDKVSEFGYTKPNLDCIHFSE